MPAAIVAGSKPYDAFSIIHRMAVTHKDSSDRAAFKAGLKGAC